MLQVFWGGGRRDTEFWTGAFGDLKNQVETLLPGNVPLLDKNRQVETATFKQLRFKFYYVVKKKFFFWSF